MSEEILKEVLNRIKPTPEERAILKKISERIIEKIAEIAREKGIEARGLLVGSAARNTWLRGDKDLDIFILLPEDLNLDEFEKKGIEIAESVAEKFEERYAEHPYVKAFINGYEVDLVPCYAISRPEKLKSAVDRTPFHNQYVIEHIKGKEDEVLLLKQFMKGISTYGSELKTQGFSGYLCELLIIKYGSFLETLRQAKHWKYGVKIALEKQGEVEFEHPLVVIDPVDPKRNVAAALSKEKFYEFIAAAREFLEKPSLDFFFPLERKMDGGEFKEQLKKRGTAFYAVVFKSPNVVEDVLYPQLRKAKQSIEGLLEKHEFKVFKSDVYADSKYSIILLELSVWRLPYVRRHIGPPVEEEMHVKRFLAKYRSSAITLSKPYIQGDRYVVELPRKYIEAKDLLEAKLKTCALGKHLSECAKQGYEILMNEEILKIESQQFYFFLKDFFKI
ncbi:MAG: CCA tRNA nucleotidyltransferase [Methanocellales archaeon]